MHFYRFSLFSTGIAVCMLFAAPGHAADISSITQRAQAAASSGKTTQALGLYELALTQSADQPESVFGPVDGQYWQLIAKTDDFPRGLDFFTALTVQQKAPAHRCWRTKPVRSAATWDGCTTTI